MAIRKPDGTPISRDANTPSLPQGNATNVSGGVIPGATINPDRLDKVITDPNKTSEIRTFSLFKTLSGATTAGLGPPYDNVLEQFASYTPVWTLAALEPNQFNNPSTYRGNPSAVKNIVLSSAGRFDAQRTKVQLGSAAGAPEYFIDNFNMRSTLASGPAQGNTNVTQFSFDVYEPYSLGLFLQSLQTAAINAGYPSYFNDTPYLLKLEFLGFKDDGSIFGSSETLAKYFTIKITKVEFTVNEGGSNYKVEAAPLHHTGFTDLVNRIPTDVTITGENVKEVLVSGQRSLCTALNTTQLEMVNKRQQEYPDLYEIVFPVDSADTVGLEENSSSTELLKATADPNRKNKQPIAGRKGQETTDFGFGEIGRADMGFGPQSGGNYLYPLENEVIDQSTGRIQRDKMIIDPKQRAFLFPQGERLTEVIQRIIIASKYGVDAVKPENLNDKGMAKWFRIDVQIQLLEYDRIRNIRAKKYIYRVIPFLVNGAILKNPSSTTAGIENLKKIIAKRYDYLYTGQNNSIIKFDLTFNGMFYTGQLPRPITQNANIANPDTRSAAEPTKQQAEVQQGAAPESVTATTGSAMVKPDPNINSSSSSGDKTVEQVIADAFQQAFLNSSKDLINVDIEILGDPYYISDSGISANYAAQRGPNDQIRADGSMNWEGSEIYTYLTFRNPVEPNLGTVGDGGLYAFPDGGAPSPFSGIYKVTEVQNKFNGGVFQQTLKMVRQPGQPQDIEGSQAISKRNQFLYDTSKQEPPKTSPVDKEEKPAVQYSPF